MVEQLSDKEIGHLQLQFKEFDKDGDGAISAEELGLVMKSRGITLTDAELQDKVTAADADGDGAINFDEFCTMYAEQGTPEERLYQQFQMYDKDGNGFISEDELRQVLEQSGREVSDEEVKGMVEVADTDGDGKINYNEFVKIMQSAN